ncbi:MAG: arylsulfatase [Desulfatitalea sp.]|nr:arylsulfatase [Desulfatitalea sp.]NNK00659.1 arylsulfatase [Desulfatitalea sp.]
MKKVVIAAMAFAIAFVMPAGAQATTTKKPNILVIMGDDIGYWNLSYNNRGMMGYRTPNIDSIANDGMIFTDYYAQQSCTAGRAAFITGQNPIRTGLTKVGMPGARVGLQKEDPTIAELLKPLGYATGQFGKNHLGDRNEFLPTVHGFDEFFGNLYHLNSEEEPEQEDYPKYKGFKEKFGPRGVLHSWATEKEDNTEQPRWGRIGKQKIEDTGPLTKKRMETVDDEFLAAAQDFIKRAQKDGKPFFVWFNPTRMHFYTHIRPEHKGISGPNGNFYTDGMVEYDNMIGALLKQLDELGIADNTIVIQTTDNGPHFNEWPDGGITPFRGEKNSNWEGAYRVPIAVRWPGHIPAGMVSNGIAAHQDWLPTLLAAAGEPDINQKLLKGHKANGKEFKVHIDGENLLPHLAGKEKESPRRLFVYPTDGGEICGIRYDDWKLVYMEQNAKRMDIWRDPMVTLRAPKLFNLRRDPFERADSDSNTYDRWWIERVGNVWPGAAVATEFFETFKQYPPRQKPEKWNLSEVMERIQAQPLNR